MIHNDSVCGKVQTANCNDSSEIFSVITNFDTKYERKLFFNIQIILANNVLLLKKPIAKILFQINNIKGIIF